MFVALKYCIESFLVEIDSW